jgi:hypothetical protein
MTTVLIRVTTGELSEKMAGMREWLNEHRYEPSKFTCDQYGSIFAVCVDFSIPCTVVLDPAVTVTRPNGRGYRQPGAAARDSRIGGLNAALATCRRSAQ